MNYVNYFFDYQDDFITKSTYQINIILKIFFIIQKFEDLKNVSKFIDWSRGLEQDRGVN